MKIFELKKTNFGIMHFHNKLFDRYIKSAKQKLQFRVPDFNKETLMSYNGPGIHLIRTLLGSELDYYESFKSKLNDSINVNSLFKNFKLTVPNS